MGKSGKNKDGDAMAPEEEFLMPPAIVGPTTRRTDPPTDVRRRVQRTWGLRQRQQQPDQIEPEHLYQSYEGRALRDALQRSYPGDTFAPPPSFKTLHFAGTMVQQLLMQQADAHGFNKAQQIAILRYTIAMIETELGSQLPPVLPTKAPALWADRDPDLKTNPAKFTTDTYKDWIGKGLTRQHLRELDPQLYHALSVWEHRHPEDRIENLPTLAEVIDMKIASLANEFEPEELRKLGTTLQTRLRRSKK